MEIGIIGAGFTGLAAAIRLSQAGHKVTVFEKEDRPGGLATGFKDKGWEWPLEKHYHHFFVSDIHIRRLAEEVGHPIFFTRPVTSTFVKGGVYQLDSPISLLKFRPLPMFDRLRTGAGLAFLKINPFWKPLEYTTAHKFIRVVMGENSWSVIWEPLFRGKFHHFADSIAASWFWTRINKRSMNLGYPEGGYENLARSFADYAQKLGAKINYGIDINQIVYVKSKIDLETTGKKHRFDKVICTLPTPLLIRLAPQLPRDYINELRRLTGIGAVNLVLALKKPFLKGTYWLNINEKNMPFLAVVEHTNYQNPAHYGGDRLVYIGNYLPTDHEYFKKSASDLVKIFTPHLKKINPDFKSSWIRSLWVWKAPFAQPIVTPRYSRLIPPLDTPIPNLYLANIQQVYPWDRGTNYAVELGEKVAAHAVAV